MQVNIPLIHQVVVAQLAAARQGTHDTKTRGEVRGGGRKPYRQKGTGRARQGSTRAPQFAGGGVVHGPTPRDYAQRTPKKMKAAALRGALSDRARDGRVHVVDRPASTATTPSTKAAHRRRWRAIVRAPARAGRRSSAATSVTWKSLRNVDRACTCSRPTSSTPTTCWSPTTSSSPRARSRVPRGPDARQGRQGRRHASRATEEERGMSTIADPRDILLAPVVSEKSYGLLDENKYTFLVAPGRQQDRDQDRGRAGLRRQGR